MLKACSLAKEKCQHTAARIVVCLYNVKLSSCLTNLICMSRTKLHVAPKFFNKNLDRSNMPQQLKEEEIAKGVVLTREYN